MDDPLLTTLEAADARRCLVFTDRASGLRAAIVIDDLTLGPAAGGIRTLAYPSLAAGVADAAALARAMTIKCALGGLEAGGGKGVVLLREGMDRRAVFERLGEHVEELAGLFRTAGDLGTTRDDLEAMASRSRFVHVDEGDLSAAVARGLRRCIEACRAVREGSAGATVAGLRVAVQGCGAIGAAAARELAAAGADLVVADVDTARATEVADQTGASTLPPEAILTADVDVLAPCAIGGVVTPAVAGELRAWAVCGGANNVLAAPDAEDVLRTRGVLFVPDVVSSAGAVIDGVGRTVMGLDDRTPLIDRLGETAREILEQALRTDTRATSAAWERARARIEAARISRR